MRVPSILLLLALCFACDDAASGPDAVDAFVDAAAIDAATAPLDAAGVGADAGRPVDAGMDAAAPDAGAGAAGTQAAFYDPAVVQQIELDIAPADWAAMHAALPERVYVPATFRWGGIVLDAVGVRFKGNSSSSPNARHKRSFLLKFGEFVDGQRFLGLRRVALDNAVQFGSLFSEVIVTDVLRAEGVIAPRANHASLTLNGEPYGVYVNVERIDDSFLETYFGGRDGQLYKADEGGPGSDLTRLPDPSGYAQAFEPKTREDVADHRDLAAFVDLIYDTPADRLAPVLEERFALEPFLRLMAVMVFAGAFDQYTGWNPHNFYLYDDPRGGPSGRWHYLPWDLDVGFADNAFGRVPVLDGWIADYPLPRVPRPLLERILAHPALLARYRAHADRILEAYFKPDAIHQRLLQMHARLAPALARDPFPHQRITNPGDRDYSHIVEQMAEFARRRYASARAQLDTPMGGPPAPTPDPTPGAPSADAPTDLRVVSADADAVELTWVPNAVGEAGHIVQRCTGVACEDFVNRIPRPGAGSSAARDTRVEAGQTYRYRVYGVHMGNRGTGPSNVVDATP